VPALRCLRLDTPDIVLENVRRQLEKPMAENFLPGYHTRPIEKGVLGEPSKIMEEAMEFIDACAQGVKVMALVELSDMMGAVQAYLAKHHPACRSMICSR
jgi:phosphoribosyl-ATP pyrophosphohydrolase